MKYLQIYKINYRIWRQNYKNNIKEYILDLALIIRIISDNKMQSISMDDLKQKFINYKIGRLYLVGSYGFTIFRTEFNFFLKSNSFRNYFQMYRYYFLIYI